MFNHIHTEVFASDLKSPSASSDHRCGKFQDTEPIDEALVLGNSLLETPFQKLYDDTELVDNKNYGDEVRLNKECYGLEEVVDDSEDEDGGNGSAAPVESSCLREQSLKAADILLESDGSNDHEFQTGKQESNCNYVTSSSRITANSHGPGLDFLSSQEPGESTQAAALGFVDHFLMEKDLELSPDKDLPENSWRMKSPPVSGAKGCQSLAKIITNRSPTRKMSVFDWGSEQCDVSDRKNSLVTRGSATCFKRREDHVADDDPRAKKGLMELYENRKVSNPPTQSFMHNTYFKYDKTEQGSGFSQGIMLISLKDAQLLDKASKEHLEPEEEFIDIGVSTQIAAEAISALMYAPFIKEEACESDPIPGKRSETSDQVVNHSRRNNDTTEDGTERDNLSRLLTVPHKDRNFNKRKFTMEKRTGTNLSAVTCLQNLCEWKHPRAKRSRLMQRHHVPRRKIQASSCQSDVIDLDVANHTYRNLYDGSHESPWNKDYPRSFHRKELTIKLGGPGKVGDLVPKELRRRRSLAHVRVLFSQNLDDETIKKQRKIMVRLGISSASSSADSTHFIADRFSRTRKMLEAIALGKPVVTPLWLKSCGETRCLIDEKSYILRDSKKEKDGFSMLKSLARAKQHPLLKGLKVCITPNVKPDRGMIAHLVELSQGQVVEIRETIGAEDRNFPDDLLILSCGDDRDLCLPLINRGAVVYTSELLLHGIVIQKLEFARHRLF